MLYLKTDLILSTTFSLLTSPIYFTCSSDLRLLMITHSAHSCLPVRQEWRRNQSLERLIRLCLWVIILILNLERWVYFDSLLSCFCLSPIPYPIPSFEQKSMIGPTHPCFWCRLLWSQVCWIPVDGHIGIVCGFGDGDRTASHMWNRASASLPNSRRPGNVDCGLTSLETVSESE